MLSMADSALSSYNHLPSTVTPVVSGKNSISLQSPAYLSPSPEVHIFQREQEQTWSARRSPPSSSSLLSSLPMDTQEKTPFVECSAAHEAHSPENSASIENPDENHVNTTAQKKKPALNNLSHGVVEDGPVMGGVALPVLSESGSPFADGSPSTSQEPANLLHPQNQTAVNPTPHSTSNHAIPIQQRFNPRGTHFRPSQAPAPPPPPSFPMFRGPHNGYGYRFPPMENTYLGEPSYQNNHWNPRPFGGYFPPPPPVNNHHGFSQRGNFNPSIRGGHDRGRFDNGRNFHMNQHRPHLRSPWRPPTMPPNNFFSPPPVRSYGDHRLNHARFDSYPLEYYRGQHFEPQLPNMQDISSMLVDQINYYFCADNLARDAFLRSHMDDQGWVSIYLVADFPRVKGMTSDIRFILDSLRASTVVEVEGYKIRRRNEWIKWIMKKNPTPTTQLVSAAEPAQDLITKVQDLKIDEVVRDPTSTNDH